MDRSPSALPGLPRAVLLLLATGAPAVAQEAAPPIQLSVCTADKTYDNPDPHPRRVCGPDAEPPAQQLPLCVTSDHFGSAFAAGGDLDGDGQPDLAVGSLSRPDSTRISSQVWIFSGLQTAPLMTLDGDGRTDLFGASLCVVPDLDGDGRDELAIGAPNAGRVYLVPGRVPSSPAEARRPVREVASLILQGGRMGDGFGTSLAVGDVDGDGRVDLIVGAPGSPTADPHGFAGRVSVFSGADLAPTTDGGPRMLRAGSALRSWQGHAAVDRLGTSLAVLDDLDGAPGVEIAAGAPQLDEFLADGATPAGPGYVLLLTHASDEPWMRLGDGAHGPAARHEATLPVTHAEGFGKALAATPDLDGDGHADLVVGAPLYSRPAAADGPGEQGRVFVLSSADGALVPPFDELPVLGVGPKPHLGTSLAVVSDATGDGRPDLFVGAMLASHALETCRWGAERKVGGPMSGLVQLVELSTGRTAARITGEAPRDRIGFALGAHDMDGDGLADLFTGGMGWSPGERPPTSRTEVGRVYLVRGLRFVQGR